MADLAPWSCSCPACTGPEVFDPPGQRERELEGPHFANAIDALPAADPETRKIRSAVALRGERPWTPGDVTIPPAVVLMLEAAGERVEAARKKSAATRGVQAKLC